MAAIYNPELADIFKLYGEEYREKYKDRILPSHKKAMWAIEKCRTPVLGGQLYECKDCNRYDYSYHSCNNRNCPKCGGGKIQSWIMRQFNLLMPVPYFFSTFTLPHELNKAVYANQRLFYDLFFKTSAQALKELACDKRFVGGKIGFFGILQTWARDLSYHIHIHYIVPGVALSFDRKKWIKIKNKKFLIHVKPLGCRFKNLFKKSIQKTLIYDHIPQIVWKKDWNVYVEPAGYGQEIIKYIAPYVYRIALSNRNIIKLKDHEVTFKYKDNKTNITHTPSLDVLKFIHRFLQHVLPPDFMKVRYFGIMGANIKDKYYLLKYLLVQSLSAKIKKWFFAIRFDIKKKIRSCPHCGGKLILIGRLSRAP